MERNQQTLLLLVLLLFCGFSAQPSHLKGAGSILRQIDYVPSDDSYVIEEISTNYGSEPNLYVLAVTGTGDKRTFLQFDVSTITSSCTFINATLKLYVTNTDADETLQVHRTAESFSEDTINWDNQPSVTTNHLNVTSPASTNEWWSVNVTSLFESSKDLGFRIKHENESSDPNTISFRSKEYTGVDYDPVLTVFFQYEYMYTFDGEYYEDGSDAGDVCVDVHFANFSQSAFIVDGVTQVYLGEQPLFYSWPVDSYLRVYYPPNNDSFKVYSAQTPFYVYSFTLRDYPAIIDDGACFESYRVVSNVLALIERRNVKDNVGNTVPLIMEQGASYLLVLNTSTCEYRFGYYLAGSVLEKDLPLPYIDFPSTIKLAYANVRADATRSADNKIITVNYEDMLDATNNVTLYITYRNNTVAYSDTSTASTVQFQWNNADNQTDYIAYVMADHDELGELGWKILLEHLRDYDSPWTGLSYLGSWPIEPKYVVSVIIILVVAGSFSTLTVTAGLFSATVTTGILVYIGWLSLTGNQQADYYLLSVIGGFIVLNGIADYRRRNR